jgi:hypothetical protein
VDTSKIRVREHFGIVTNETSTKKIRFLISPPKGRQSIQQQDLVLLDHPIYGDACQIIAQVYEIASYEEVAGSTHSDRLGKLLANAYIIGYVNLEKPDMPLQKLLAPPNPGSRIYMPYVSFIEDIYTRDRLGKPFEQPLHMGYSETCALTPEGTSKQISICLNSKDLMGMHTLIAAVTGAGKTGTVQVLLEEFTQKNSIPIVVVDPNGEYTSLSATNYTKATLTPQTKTLPKTAPNQLTILNGQGISLEEKTKYFNSQISALVKAKLEKTVPSFILVIEDPENLNADLLKEVVASKLGITGVLVTSHPAGLHATVLSQMGNQILGKTFDPTDNAQLRGMLNCSEQELLSLCQSEFIFNGLNLARPVKVQVKLAEA